MYVYNERGMQTIAYLISIRFDGSYGGAAFHISIEWMNLTKAS